MEFLNKEGKKGGKDEGGKPHKPQHQAPQQRQQHGGGGGGGQHKAPR